MVAPAQMLPFPEISATGGGITFTVAEKLLLQPVPFKATTVYEVVTEGVSGNWLPVTVPLE